ncbi:MAG: hypothetical protein NVS3B15_09600 [Sediminibacterium sp.]
MKRELLFFLVDDDMDDQDIFKDALKEIDPSFKVVTAVNGIQAIQQLTKAIGSLPDFIFIDLNMPLMNGIHCLKEVKKITSLLSIPVIIYSTSSFSKDIEDAKKYGAFDYIVKPFCFQELCERIRKVIGLNASVH